MIHYHGVAGLDAACLEALTGRHLLWSFAHSRSLFHRMREVAATHAIDSGAFTVWKSGGKIDRTAYREFVEKWAWDPACELVIGPDVIGGGYKENATVQGVWFKDTDIPSWKKCPVWHTSDGDAARKHLGYLCAAYSHVAIGSTADFEIGTAEWWAVMHAAWKVIAPDGKPRTSMHGLRMLRPEVIQRFPWASCDSTSASRNARPGQTLHGFYGKCSKAIKVVAYAQRLEAARPPHVYAPDTERRALQPSLWAV